MQIWLYTRIINHKTLIATQLRAQVSIEVFQILSPLRTQFLPHLC